MKGTIVSNDHTIHISRDTLIEKLEMQRVRARALDEKQAAQHKKAELHWETLTRARIKKLAVKKNFPTYKALASEIWGPADEQTGRRPGPYDRRPFNAPPACPLREELHYERALARLEMDTRTKFQLSQFGQNRGLFELLAAPLGRTVAVAVCDE